MQLTFLLAPVPDLATALPFYRDTLGLDEAWREGANTVAFHLPDRKAQIMVVAGGDPAGPMYKVDSVPAFLAEHLRRRLWKKEKRQIEAEASNSSAAASARDVDASKCPDCFGTGMWYPEGFEKGVARCRHEKLTSEEQKKS